jgi:hypothetical protein
VWPAATLAPSFSALEADVAAQLAPVRGIERSQLRADWHRYAVFRDQRCIIDAGGQHPQPVGVGVGKRRWYATIFSFDRPRSRSMSTERRGGSLSRAGFTPRSSSLWPLPWQSLVFTHASPVFIPAVPSMFNVNAVLFMTTRIAFMAYLSSLTGMRRLARRVLVSPHFQTRAVAMP